MAAVRVKARLELLPTAEGGRHSPVRWPYRPNHNFGTLDEPNFRMGQVEMLPEAAIREIVWPGRRWLVQEGPRLFGHATAIEILD